MARGDTDLWMANSGEFTISCGVVPLDIARKVALVLRLKDPQKNYCVLPKGRKNCGEKLEDAATRECTEESGYRCSLMPHSRSTKATKAYPNHTEAIALQHRVMSQNAGHLIVLWFVGQVDSTEAPSEVIDDGDRYVAEWVPFVELLGTLHYDQDVQVAREALVVAGHLSKDQSAA